MAQEVKLRVIVNLIDLELENFLPLVNESLKLIFARYNYLPKV